MTIQEKPTSRGVTTGRDPGGKLEYTITGSDDPVAVAAFAQANISAFYNANVLGGIEINEIASQTWEVVAKYTSIGDFKQTGDTAFQFDTSGGSQRVYTALSHQHTYDKTGVVSGDLQGSVLGAINEDGSIEGTDIEVNGFCFDMTIYPPADNVTSSYIALLYSLTNTVNATSITVLAEGVELTFNDGEVRFRGARGGKRKYGDWEINLSFAAQPNFRAASSNTLTIGTGSYAIANIECDGWDHIDVENKIVSDSATKRLVSVPSRVRVNRVYQYKNWTGIYAT